MKLIFLDIDGVLNSSNGRGPSVSDMEVEKLILLKKLIDESGAFGVVITSDRRFSEVDMKNKTKAFNVYKINVVGATRNPNENDYEDNRGRQIMDFLSSYKEEIDRIVILDDNDDGISSLFDEEFILANRFFGLNEDVFQRSLRLLMYG